jgi:hypothetical protein
MRLPISSVIASLVVALITPSSPAVAQQESSESTIRLTSAVEADRESSSYESTAQPGQPSMEPRQVAQPIQSLGQPAEQSDRSFARPAVHMPLQSPTINQTRMPAGFYASPAARSTLNQLPGPAPVQSAPRLQNTRRGGKPFQAISPQSTISPYLYMNAGTNTATPITNYLAFVRPQMEQAESGRQQQREIQQLRSQLQKMSSNGPGSQSVNSNPAARYMDTAQFYRGLQR